MSSITQEAWTLREHGNLIIDDACWWFEDDAWSRRWQLAVETGVEDYGADETWFPWLHDANGQYLQPNMKGA